MAHCNLPVEIIAKIFIYLDAKSIGRAAQVCSSWREASFYRPAWCGISARIIIDNFAEFTCTNLSRRDIKNVQVLRIQRNLVHMLRLIPHLEKLDLSHCKHLSDTNLMKTFKSSFFCLTELNLSMCTSITSEGVRTALYACEKLHVLDLSGCSKISNDVLFVIALQLLELKTLNISDTSVTDRGLNYFCGFNSYNKYRQSIECLIMMNCQLVTDVGLDNISRGLLRLKVLDLRYCKKITDFGMRYVARMDSLEELNLQHCSWLTNNGLSQLCRFGSLPLLSLSIGPCEKVNNVGMLNISLKMRSLRHLQLDSCNVNDDGVHFLCHNLFELRSLSITECAITDASLGKIHDCCMLLGLLPRLQLININACSGVTTAGISKVSKVPEMTVNLDK